MASVGCASIDVQHALLVKLIENVTNCLRNSAPDEMLLGEVQEFRSALVSHFGAEQDQLAASGFEGGDEHAAKHAEVLARLDAAQAALRHVSSASARFAIINEIEDALYSHELLDDSEYAGQIGDARLATDWDESMRIGIDWVDDQHRQLFVMLNVFRRHASREEWSMCDFVLKRLIERVKTHFDNEDTYLKTLGLAAFGHRRHHFEALLSLEELLEKSDTTALKRIDVFIYQLLRNHIVDEDMKDLAST